ncbi:hypothetical protein ES703_25616 [subsurface metagenome]
MLEAHGAIVLRPHEKSRFTAQVFDPDHLGLKRSIIGKPAQFIADSAGIRRDKDIRLIVVPIKQDELQGSYGHEKLAPILSLSTANDEAEGLQVCRQILANQGRGHTAVIYTENQELMKEFGREVDASRILVNAPASQGCIGLGTGLTPSFTLGCGTFEYVSDDIARLATDTQSITMATHNKGISPFERNGTESPTSQVS